MIRIFRILLVLLTIGGFLNIFIDNMIFDEDQSDMLYLFAHNESIIEKIMKEDD